jgi:hypothetical protein
MSFRCPGRSEDWPVREAVRRPGGPWQLAASLAGDAGAGEAGLSYNDGDRMQEFLH